MPFTIRLVNQKSGFIAQDHETILDAALRQNFDLPHSCCEGICGSCEGKILDGIVHYSNTQHLALDDQERAQGKALFCSAYPLSDLLIDVPGMTAPKEHKARPIINYQLMELNLIGNDIYQALLTPESTHQTISYLAGQYLEVILDQQEIKPFSIANAPNKANIIELHIRCQRDNLYAQQLIHSLKQTKTISLRGPYGHCFYHPTPKKPAILIAVGTGFAPIKAILEDAFAHGLTHETILFWAGKSIEDLYLQTQVKQWNQDIELFRCIPVLAPPFENPDLLPGVVYGNVLDIVLDYYPHLENHHIYFGGPIQLTLDALEHFIAYGAQTYSMYSDVFDLI